MPNQTNGSSVWVIVTGVDLTVGMVAATLRKKGTLLEATKVLLRCSVYHCDLVHVLSFALTFFETSHLLTNKQTLFPYTTFQQISRLDRCVFYCEPMEHADTGRFLPWYSDGPR